MVKKMLYNTLLYFIILIGFFFLYVINIENIIYDNPKGESKSKINFIYQQF
jgi:hypothetical protein